MTSILNSGSFGAPLLTPLVPPDFVYCNRAYGTGLTYNDAVNAGARLPQGTVPVTYSVEDSETDDLAMNVSALAVGYELPFLEFYRGVSLTVDVSGPISINSIRVVPNDIREMAALVARECVGRDGGIGGFVTRGMQGLVDFVTNPTSDIDGHPYPPSTAYLTLMISNHATSATFPGDYDPAIARVLQRAEVAAYSRAGPRQRPIFAQRIEKFEEAESRMRRLGTDVSWWEGWLLQGNRTTGTNIQRANMTTQSVTTARRRKRTARCL